MAKVLFQKLCREGFAWDDELPESKMKRRQIWFDDLKEQKKLPFLGICYPKSKVKLLM